MLVRFHIIHTTSIGIGLEPLQQAMGQPGLYQWSDRQVRQDGGDFHEEEALVLQPT